MTSEIKQIPSKSNSVIFHLFILESSTESKYKWCQNSMFKALKHMDFKGNLRDTKKYQSKVTTSECDIISFQIAILRIASMWVPENS